MVLQKSPSASGLLILNLVVLLAGSSELLLPRTDKVPDGLKTAYFRGRKLRGRTVKLPARYQGIVTKSTNRTLPSTSSRSSASKIIEDVTSDEDEEEERQEPVKLLENSATFEEIVVWGHDQLPAADDTYVKGVEEWIAFAEAIHLEPPTIDQQSKQT